ncbi:hypothetical protein PO124_31410 [Bacillus licheniformis]|nr:hypothetical protein [Bacillus licheniformis]
MNLTIDYLIHEQPLYIVGEITAPIRQHLLVHPTRKRLGKTFRRFIPIPMPSRNAINFAQPVPLHSV